MKLQKHEVCVFIENKAHLQEARELLEKYREEIDSFTFILSEGDFFNYLRFSYYDKDWCLGNDIHLTQITLSQLETILKETFKSE